MCVRITTVLDDAHVLRVGNGSSGHINNYHVNNLLFLFVLSSAAAIALVLPCSR